MHYFLKNICEIEKLYLSLHSQKGTTPETMAHSSIG